MFYYMTQQKKKLLTTGENSTASLTLLILVLGELHSGRFSGQRLLSVGLGWSRDNLRGQNSLGPLKMSLEMAHKVILPPKKNYIPQFLKQRDINSYLMRSGQFKGSKKSRPPQNVPRNGS